MPNGGSDCCGTCRFNTQKDWEKGYQTTRFDGYCRIRELDIPNPFWTYCANHPHHNFEQTDIPLGPVLVYDKSYPSSRKVWKTPPDNELIRLRLLSVLENFNNELTVKYPSPTILIEEVINQVTYLQEERALPYLIRMTQFDLSAYQKKVNWTTLDKAAIVGQAIEAILSISEGALLPEVSSFINLGLEDFSEANYKPEEDGFASIRYHLVRGLRFCQGELKNQLLITAQTDPHSEVRQFANGMQPD